MYTLGDNLEAKTKGNEEWTAWMFVASVLFVHEREAGR